MIILPSNKQWTQPNNSDNTGSIWVTKGIDFDENYGRVRIGKRMVLNTGLADNTALTGYPIHFDVVGSNIYTVAGLNGSGYASYASSTNPLTGTFTRDADAKAPTNADSTKSDAIFSRNTYYVTVTTAGAVNVHNKVGNLAWGTAFQASIYGGYPNMMCSYGGRTYMSDIQSQVISWDSSNSVSTTPGTYCGQINTTGDFTNLITKLVPDKDGIWVLCVNTTGGRGYVYKWNGTAATINGAQSYILESSGALAGVMHEGVLHIVDTMGRLLAWNGGQFQVLAELNRESSKLLYNPLSLTNDRFIHPNGIAIIDGLIHLLIDNRNNDSTYSTEETIPSGVWVYQKDRGLTHKYPLAVNKSGDTLTDFGMYKILGAGAIHELDLPSNSASKNGHFLAGASYYTNATGTSVGIFYDDLNDTLKKAGYLVTSKIDATDANGNPSIKNTINDTIITFRKLLGQTDKIVVKYRVSESSPTDFTGTWVNTTSFTTTTDLSAYWTSGTGGEIEVQTGTGAGICAHVTGITGSTTFTVTIDETVTGATSTSLIRAQSWKKLMSVTSQNETYERNSPNESSNWVQFKLFLWWTGKNELEKIFINNSNTLPAIK